MKRTELDKLEDLDPELAEKLADMCSPLDEAAQARILSRIDGATDGIGGGSAETVSGVDIYKRPAWRKFAAAAAAVLLTAGFAGGAYLAARSGRGFRKDEDTVPVSAAESEDMSQRASVQEDTSGEGSEGVTDGNTESGQDNSLVEPVTSAEQEIVSSEGTQPPTEAENPTSAAVTTAEYTEVTTASTTVPDTVPDISPVEVNFKKSEVREWFSRPLGSSDEALKVTLGEYFGDKVFIARDDGVYWKLRGGTGEYRIEGGFAVLISDAYFTDVNGDGYPELCMTVEAGSGVSINYILVYDIRNDKRYSLFGDDNCSYSLQSTDDADFLAVKKTWSSISEVIDGQKVGYSESAEVKGRLALIGETLMISRRDVEVTEETAKKCAVCDVNRDGTVNCYDAYLLLHYIAQKRLGTVDSYIESIGDTDGDGAVKAVDVSWVYMYLKKVGIPGDINEDGTVDSKDAEYLSDCVEHMDELSTTQVTDKQVQFMRCNTFGDLNADGEINAADADFLADAIKTIK
ncbi:MAG: hypothetical protein IKO47_11655 [Ruminococcus sp.]|nr:hypothetical protein [Ruminococcus sp.]